MGSLQNLSAMERLSFAERYNEPLNYTRWIGSQVCYSYFFQIYQCKYQICQLNILRSLFEFQFKAVAFLLCFPGGNRQDLSCQKFSKITNLPHSVPFLHSHCSAASWVKEPIIAFQKNQKKNSLEYCNAGSQGMRSLSLFPAPIPSYYYFLPRHRHLKT
jgi:hypothetical protein